MSCTSRTKPLTRLERLQVYALTPYRTHHRKHCAASHRPGIEASFLTNTKLTTANVFVCERLAEAVGRSLNRPPKQQRQLCQEFFPENPPLLFQPVQGHSCAT